MTPTCVDNLQALREMVAHLQAEPAIAWDHETCSADYRADPDGALKKMTMLSDIVSFATAVRLYVVPIGMVTMQCLPATIVFSAIKPIMESPKIVKRGWNCMFDMHAQANYGVWVRNFLDIMIAGNELDENRGNGLKERCADVQMELHPFPFDKYWSARDEFLNGPLPGKRPKKITRDQLSVMEQDYLNYGGEDAEATFKLGDLYLPELQKNPKLYKFFIGVKNAAVRTLFNMERRGMPIDREFLRSKRALCLAEVQAAEKAVYASAGVHFNLGSVKELGDVLYNKLGLPVYKYTAKGAPSTDADVLDKMAQRGHQIAFDLLKWRKHSKMFNTYLAEDSTVVRLIYPWGHIHPNFNPSGTVIGRLSSSTPNVQNWPRSNEASEKKKIDKVTGKEKIIRTKEKNYAFRKCLIASPGYRLVGGDWSQVELRIMAHMSQDANMVAEYCKDAALQKAIMEGRDVSDLVKSDIHQATADACRASRQLAKSINFGLLYGMGAEKLAATLTAANWDECYDKLGTPEEVTWDPVSGTISPELAKEFIVLFFNKYPGIREYQYRIQNKARQQGYIETRFGHVRHLPDVYSSDNYLQHAACRQAVNCVDSETEALTKRGWVKGFDLLMSDEILTKNARSGLLEWQKPTHIHLHRGYKGLLYKFTSKCFSAVTTPDHRWLVDGKRNRNICRLSKDLSAHGDDSIHRTGNYALASDGISLDECALIGWFMSDGFITKPYLRSGNKSPTVGLCQSIRANPEYVVEIQSLLDKLRIKHSKRVDKKTQCVYWKLSVADSSRLIAWFPDREMTPEFALTRSAEQAAAILDAWYKGDGTKSERQRWSITTRSEQSAGAIQYLYMLAGYATTSRYRKSTPAKKQYASMNNIPKSFGCWVVSVLRRQFVQVTKAQRVVSYGIADMWCPVVPNTYFVARREGCVYITGNTTIQGHVGELMLYCMNNIEQTCPLSPERVIRAGAALRKIGYRMFLQVHDEILGECPDSDDAVQECKIHLAQIFQAPFEPSESYPHYGYRVPLIFEPASGDTWQNVH